MTKRTKSWVNFCYGFVAGTVVAILLLFLASHGVTVDKDIIELILSIVSAAFASSPYLRRKMKKSPQYKSVVIRKEDWQRISAYCKHNALSIGPWLGKLAIEEIRNEQERVFMSRAEQLKDRE